MRDFVPFSFACSGLRCNTSHEYQDTQLIHLVCMSVSLKTVYFGFKPNLYIYIVIYLYIYIHNNYCTVNNFILLSNNNIILLIIVNVYILRVIYGYFILLLSLHVPFESSITCEMLYTVTVHNCDYYEHNVQK